MTSYVFFNGKIVEEDSVSISLRSKIVNYGLGVFEGIRAYWDDETEQLYGFKLLEHYERFHQSAKAVNLVIPYSPQELVDFTVELFNKHDFKETVYIRPLAFKNESSVSVGLSGNDFDAVAIYLSPMGKYIDKEEFRVCVSSWTRLADNMLPPRTKACAGYLNSALANLEAVENGYDEAILLNRHGNVCEGPGENVFLYKKGVLVTPPPADDILEGITRDLVIELAREELGIETVQRSISRTELYNSEEVFYSGTAMEVAPIVEVDGRKVGDGKAGEVCTKLKDLFAQLTHNKLEKYSSALTPIYKK